MITAWILLTVTVRYYDMISFLPGQMSNEDSQAPEWVGKYRRVSTLGRGSYGEVSMFRYNDRDYAIKRVSMLHPVSTMTEVSMYTLLSHPHIMKPYEYIVTDRGITMNIVMDMVDDTLATRNPGYSHDDIKLIMWQLLSATDYMHSNGVIHRDLKPANILIDGMYPYIIDFGLATYVPVSGSRKDHHVQTYPYRAPEVYHRDPYGYKVDIFSLGTIMYELIYGRTLLSKATPEQQQLGEAGYSHMIKSIRKAALRVQGDPSLPDQMKDVIIAMIEPIPDTRPIAEDVMHMPWFQGHTYHPPDAVDVPAMTVSSDASVSVMDGIVTGCRISEASILYAKALVIKAKDTIATIPKDRRRDILEFLLLLADNIRDERYRCSVSHTMIDRDGHRNYPLAMDVAKIFQALGYDIFITVNIRQ